MRINKYIDHTILKPETTKRQVLQICEEALQHNFASVCVNSCYTAIVANALKDSSVKTCTVIGFPLGANTIECKVFEAKNAIQNGASELDMVLNIGALKSGDLEYVKRDINAVVNISKERAIVKVILETCLLTNEEIIQACKISNNAGAQYVKTSTGFNSAGASEEHVKLMQQTVGKFMGVKASGGIQTYEKALRMINAGASRIGTSSSVKIIQEQDNLLNNKK
ncbi:MAG: deoxyribose-phosphate aldolase [Promethearchaeota archaeon]|nr:MAG: deoxyribose-phosphate aldolase [Candidatus Lokiarchaeota archaeon]